MAHTHYRYEDTSTHAPGAARQGLRLFGRFFCAAILLGLVAAGLFMGEVSTARAQQAATATPGETFTPTATAPTATAVGLTPTSAAPTPAAETPGPTAEDTLQGASAPTSTPTIIPSPTAPTPTESFSPTLLATSPLPTTKPTPTQAPTVSSQTLVTATPINYFTSLTIKAQNGVTLGEDIINGPPVPPPGFKRQVVSQDQLRAASVTSLDVPAYEWSFGCSATSGAMIAAYYDRNGYPNMYTGPTNGGVAPSDSSSWTNVYGLFTDGTGASYAQDPLAASHNGLDGRTSRGSIDDYWVAYGSSAADPFINHWSEHAPGDAIGDFMKTSQSSYGNTDGSTSFYYQPNAAPYTCNTMAAQGISQYDGTYGRILFYQARGYKVTDCYSQETDNQYPGGFSFAQYEAEINAGHPVMLNLAGHTIVGVGYDASTNPGTVYLHDTWDYLTHTMTWGRNYSGMVLQSVSIVNLQASSNPVPSISSLNPSSVTAGGSDFNLTVKGANFLASSLVNWNGTALSTTYVNSTQLTAAVPANLIPASGTAAITVFTPAPGGGTSNTQTFTINNPLPTTSGLNPNNVLAGSSTFSLTVNGTNFLSNSLVNWNGTALGTTFVSSSQLTATVPSDLIVSAGSAAVTVFNPGPGGGTSSSQTFTINNPLPVLNSISQTSAMIGSSAFTLTANGSSFVSNSVVNWNGSALSTSFISNSQLNATVPANDLTSAGTVSVTVFNPAPGGGSSSAQTFTLNNPLPLLSSLSPSTRATGTQAFTLSVDGSNFAPGANVQWDSSDLTSTFVNSGLLTASVPAADLTNPGTATITVSNPAPGGGTSAGPLNFILFSIDPAYGITVSSLRPTFDWPAVTGATSYNLQASTSSSFSSPFLNKTISAASYSPTSDIPGNSLIYWRVRALVNATWGAWSETRQFHSPNPPKAPTLSSPANNALTTNYQPNLHWSEASLPANTTFSYFDLQIATNSGFTTGLIEPSTPPITTTTYPLTTPLSPNTGYYWRVRAYNTAGQSSDWSSVYYLRSAMQPPSQLASDNVLAPANLTLRPIFSWHPVDGASSYTIQISSVSNFHTTVVNSKVTGASYTPGSDLPKNTLLYWRVQALGTNGPSLWSETDSFTSANPPSTPKLSSPSAKALLMSYTPTFYWSASTPPAGITVSYYQIQISVNANFATVLIDDLKDQNPQTSYPVSSPSLQPNTKYYWRVCAYGNNGHYSSWSSISYIRSAMLPPSMTTMANGDPVSSLRPTFSWGAVDDATNYTFQVSTSSTFSSPILNKTVTPATYTPTSNLPSGRLLYWRVRANGSNGPSLWSSGSFKTP